MLAALDCDESGGYWLLALEPVEILDSLLDHELVDGVELSEPVDCDESEELSED